MGTLLPSIQDWLQCLVKCVISDLRFMHHIMVHELYIIYILYMNYILQIYFKCKKISLWFHHPYNSVELTSVMGPKFQIYLHSLFQRTSCISSHSCMPSTLEKKPPILCRHLRLNIVQKTKLHGSRLCLNGSFSYIFDTCWKRGKHYSYTFPPLNLQWFFRSKSLRVISYWYT